MYKIWFNRGENPYELREMVRMFLPASAYEILEEDPWEHGSASGAGDLLIRMPEEIQDKNAGKRWLYDELSRYTGKKPDWGILTGVRPVKLTGDLIRKMGSKDAAYSCLTGEYRLDPDKAGLLLSTWDVQREMKFDFDEKAVALYIGIPFCPSKCIYCSFPSYQIPTEDMEPYLKALRLEIAYVSRKMKEKGLRIESLYIGGGTPTSLTEEALEELLSFVESSFDLSTVREYTVEAGRPDTITSGKLESIKAHGAQRISINPQSMKQETLEKIGRKHGPQQIRDAFQMAEKYGFSAINMDLIAGLPDEEPADFEMSLREVLAMRPENITIHTLALKRASRLKMVEEDYNYHQGQKVGEMLETAAALLKAAGYRPYYLYRQKQMTGNFENVGYALPGCESIYNVRIMEEDQTIIALGAGGISKRFWPEENRLERIANVSNYEIYIQRVDEMIQRKEKGLF